MMYKENDTLLQVLICTFGADGIMRVANGIHPRICGVEYLVSWQQAGHTPLPAPLHRDDFIIHKTDSTGLAKNRNNALSKATAPLVLISDDDIDYTPEGLMAVINAFQDNPHADLITFRYGSLHSKKKYPPAKFSLAKPPKGYFLTSFELAFRRRSVTGNVWFNENFGIGAFFPCGEEDIFLKECLDFGLSGIFLPVTIARHEGATTSGRNLMLASRPMTKGAVFLRLHPRDWPLRMLAHALREIPLWRKGLVPDPLSYCRNWIEGVIRAKRMKVFPRHPGKSDICRRR